MLSVSTLIVAAVLFSQVAAWSGNQHKMVGQIATYFLTKEAADVLPTLLTDDGYKSLANATVWADAVKKVNPYKWSASSHYVDYVDTVAVDVENTKDRNCTPVYDETVVCKDGFCVTNAITNYTARADAASNYPVDVRSEAVKFLAHYVGDITQPLHNCFHDVGGNQWFVKWNGSFFEPPPYDKFHHNLHFIWDQFMIDADVQLNYGNSYDSYVQGIIADVTTGKWAKESARWIKCEKPLVVKETGHIIHSSCPLEWSTMSNNENCKTVWENLGANNTGPDLFTNGYYDTNKEVARKYVAAAGVRLAALFNEILPAQVQTPTSSTSSSSSSSSSSHQETSSSSASSSSAVVSSTSSSTDSTTAADTTSQPTESTVTYGGNTGTLVYSAAGKTSSAFAFVAVAATAAMGILFF